MLQEEEGGCGGVASMPSPEAFCGSVKAGLPTQAAEAGSQPVALSLALVLTAPGALDEL